MNNSFDFNVFEVGNPMALGMFEQDIYNDVRDLKFASSYRPVLASEMQEILDTYHAKFLDLPGYIQQAVNDIDFV